MEIRQYARDVAYEIAAAHPGLVVAIMKKDLRGGKVLIDWSQNHPAKTTITPYSLRGRDDPHVAAPRWWDEIGPGLQAAHPRRGRRAARRAGDPFA